MNRKYTLERVLGIGLIACLAFAVSAQAQALPKGKGRADFQRLCGTCHSLERATSQRLTRGEWTRVINDMVTRGAQGTQDELDNVMTYLTANFGKPLAKADGVEAKVAPAVNEKPLSEAEIAKGAELITAKGCLSCHRMGDTGSYVGPDLSTIGARRSGDEIRASLASPKKDVSPENRAVELITSDGKTITGRLLRHDGFTVQMMDSNNQLKSFEKANLRKFEIVTRNPMTSYANQMSAQDLTGLVRYLSSLKGSENP